MTTTREARLKPEFASLYPSVEAGVWMRARQVADRVLARIIDPPPADAGLRDRVLPTSHFEFRDAPMADLLPT